MTGTNRAPTSDASTPSWASKATPGGGIGGFKDLSGIEAKSAPPPSIAATPAIYENEVPTAKAVPIHSPSAMDIGLNKLLSMGMDVKAPADKGADFGGGDTSGQHGAGRSFDVAPAEITLPKADLSWADREKNADSPVIMADKPKGKSTTYKTATATFYNGLDDEFGSKTAHPNPDGKNQAIEGTTVAVDGTTIPFGKWIEVKYADGTTKRMFTHDTGSAVKKRTASKGRGNKQPVLDFYTASKDLLGMNKKAGNSVGYRILDDSEL